LIDSAKKNMGIIQSLNNVKNLLLKKSILLTRTRQKIQSKFFWELRRTSPTNYKPTLQGINNPITSFKRNIKLASGDLYNIQS